MPFNHLFLSILLNMNRGRDPPTIQTRQGLLIPANPDPLVPVTQNPNILFSPVAQQGSNPEFLNFPTQAPPLLPQTVTRLNLLFRTSRLPNRPATTELTAIDQQPNFGRQSFQIGFNTLIASCDNTVRLPCNVTVISRDVCERWKCCWNPFDLVPCAKSVFFVSNSKQLPDYSECGVPANGTFSATVTAPPFFSIFRDLFTSRIIGGIPAVDGDWPWMAYIYERPNGIGSGFCGGSLISSKWVITAAHCIQTLNPVLYGIVLGAHTISKPSGREIFRFVSRIARHPLFDPVSFNYDVLLLEMDTDVVFNEFIRPICIVPAGTRTDAIIPPTFAGKVCTTLGWGVTSSPGGSRSDILMRLDLVITPINLCEALTLANSSDYGFRPVFSESPKFCAGNKLGQDSCFGDSGGPLMCLQDDGKYYLHGLTSYGTSTCAIGLPGVYTKIADLEVNQFITSTVRI